MSIWKSLISLLLALTTFHTFSSARNPTNTIEQICNANEKICTVDLIAYGKVQHVHFRESVLNLAIQHHLTGMDKNLKDDNVHIILQGQPQDVMNVIQLLINNKFNSPEGYVEKLEIRNMTNSVLIPSFTILKWTSTRYCVSEPRNIVWHPSNDTYYYSKEEADTIIYQLFSPWIKCQPKHKY